jgi:hypothetical protein
VSLALGVAGILGGAIVLEHDDTRVKLPDEGRKPKDGERPVRSEVGPQAPWGPEVRREASLLDEAMPPVVGAPVAGFRF